jgi:hypothetical protein
MIVGCPVCPNKKEADRTTQINSFLIRRCRRNTALAILLLISQACGFFLYHWISNKTEYYSKRICYHITNSKEVVYFDDKCYLPNIEGNLDFIVDLSELGYERMRIRLLD